MSQEKILIENPNRFVLFPIEHQDIWDYYKIHSEAFWRVEEVDLSKDMDDWENKLNDNERFFIKNVLAFFAASDGIVVENLAENFVKEVQYAEAKSFYGFQLMMENIHSEQYSLLIDTYIKNKEEKDECFNGLQTLEPVKMKGEWALKWIKSESFAERLIAFIAVEGIFFSGSFCAIFWLKSRGLMPGLCLANAFISRDEALHCDFAINLYNNHIENKLPKERVYEILKSALDIEKKFVDESLPVSLIGINSKLMIQYLEYVADQLLIQLKLEPIYNSKNPFDFMAKIIAKGKQNFFENRPSEYKKAKSNESLSFDDDF